MCKVEVTIGRRMERDLETMLNDVNHSGRLLLHRRMLPSFQRLLIDAHGSEVNRSHLTIALSAFG